MKRIFTIIFTIVLLSCNADDKTKNIISSTNNDSNLNLLEDEPLSLDEEDFNKILIGEWIVDIVVARYPQFMVYLPDGNFLFYTESFRSINDILGCTGKWKLENNELYIFPINELTYDKLVEYETGMEAGRIGPLNSTINVRKYENISWFKIDIATAIGFQDSVSEGYFRYFTIKNQGDFRSPFSTEQIIARRHLAMAKPVNTKELIKYAK